MRHLAFPAGSLALTALSPATASAAEAPACPALHITEYPVPIPFGRLLSPGESKIGRLGPCATGQS